MNLTGFRTYLVMAVSGFLVPVLAKHGLNLDADQQGWVVGAVMAVVGVIMRTITHTSPGKTTPTLPPPSPSANRQGGYITAAGAVRLLWAALLATAFLCVLTACASVPAPKTLDQSLAYVEGAVITAQQAVTTALAAGQITSAQAVNANNLSLNVLSIVSTARAAEGSSLSSAQADLTLAQSALTALQQYLTTAKGK
jgi:uncharacterized membrane protein